jgi:hypothetical protein
MAILLKKEGQMRYFKLLSIFVLLIFVTNIFSQSEILEVKKIILIDDSEFVGTIVKEDNEIIYFKTRTGINIEIKKSLVKEIVTLESKGSDVKQQKKYRPGDHELLLMPTAYTMEDNQWYFSDYELFFLNFTYAASNSTHIGVFTLFPITSSFLETITLGIKQNYLKSEKFQSAVWGTYTPDAGGLSIGNVVSFGQGGSSFHLGLSGWTGVDDESDHWELLYMIGGRIDISRKTCLLLEYTNANSAAKNGFEGIISLGFRFIGESVAWEIGGFRPLQGTGDADIFLIPLLKATVLFD